MRTIHLMMIALWVSLLAAAPVAAKPIVIKFTHVVAVDTPKGQAAEYFKKLVEERSGGQMIVEVYPNSSLFDDKDVLEPLMTNAIQMAAPAFSKFTKMAPQLQLFKASGKTRIHELTADQRKAWKEKMVAIYPEFYDVIGKDLIDESIAEGAGTSTAMVSGKLSR